MYNLKKDQGGKLIQTLYLSMLMRLWGQLFSMCKSVKSTACIKLKKYMWNQGKTENENINQIKLNLKILVLGGPQL